MPDTDACCSSFPPHPDPHIQMINGTLSCRPHGKSRCARPRFSPKSCASQSINTWRVPSPLCDLFWCWNWHRKEMQAIRASVLPAKRWIIHLGNSGRLQWETPDCSHIPHHGCSWGRGELWQPWFLSDERKATTGRAEWKGSHFFMWLKQILISANKARQAFSDVSKTLMRQHFVPECIHTTLQNHKHLLSLCRFLGARCLLPHVGPFFSAE